MHENNARPITREQPSGTSTSRSLLQGLRDDDADAWSRLVSLYAPLVYHWSRRLGVADQDVADVVQEVFRAVSRNISRFRKERPKDTFRGWLRVITRSKATDHFRRQERQPHGAGGSVAQHRFEQLPDNFDDETTDEPVYNELYLRALELIQTEFRPTTWQAFWRVVVEGKETREVAEELSMKPGTVRVAKSRVLSRLRQELGDLPE